MKLRISLGQLDINFGNPESNEEKIVQWTAEAAAQGSDLVLFPELWSTGYDLENCQRHAVQLGKGIFSRCAELALKHHIYFGGSLLEKDGPDVYNTFVLYRPDGELLGAYRKIHLFCPMDEDKWLCAGDRLVIADTAWGRAGLSICYDLRFPEVFRHFALNGANLALIPAEWPAARLEHWHTLLRARAIENQIFVIATNRTGNSPTEKFGGFSAIIDPWGDTLLEANQDEGLFSAVIDLDDVYRIRERIPIIKDRRPDIYGEF
jgi:omega-amidase